MHRSKFIPAALAAAIGLYGCGGVSDPAPKFNKNPEGGIGNVAPIFNVSNGEFPIPNDILFSLQATKALAGTAESELPASEQEGLDGTMFASYDPTNPVLIGLDHMDGASTLAHIDIKFDGSLDASQTLDARPFVLNATLGSVVPNPNQNVFLLPLRYAGGDPVSTQGSSTSDDATDNETPTLSLAYDYGQAAAFLQLAALVQAGTATAEQQAIFNGMGGLAAVSEVQAELSNAANNPEVRAEIISLDGGTDNVIRITPLRPLEPRTKYLVVLGKNITTATGEAIAESAFYRVMSDDTATQTGSAAAIQSAILGWEQLANGWFSFVESIYAAAGSAIEFDPGIALSYTFSTGDPQAVLKYIAAPALFFTDSATVTAKQDAIANVLSGTFVVFDSDGDTSDVFFSQIPGGQATCAAPPSQEVADACTDAALAAAVNDKLLAQLTDPTWDYFSPTLASAYGTAVAGGATSYSALLTAVGTSAASMAHYLQLSAAEAAINADLPGGGGITIGQYIANTSTSTVSGGLEALLPQPISRSSSIAPSGCLGDLSSGCNNPNNFLYDEDAGTSNGVSVLAQGQITLPYYLSVPDGSNPVPLVNESWEADETLYNTISASLEAAGQDPLPAFPSDKVTYRIPFPAKKADVTVPVVSVYPSEDAIEATRGLLGQPACTAGTDCRPAGGWPVIIYHHGITANRTNALPIGHAMANACLQSATAECFATIAIDQPLHGIAPQSGNVNDLAAVGTPGDNVSLQERHFYYTAGSTIPVAMTDTTGGSGSMFANFANPPTGRDNNRQAAVDLMNLLASLGDMDIDGDATNQPDFNVNRVYFVGHSLGGVNGIPFLSVNNNSAVQASQAAAGVTPNTLVQAAGLMNTGGFYTQLLMSSPSVSFGAPRILATLAASGITQGSSDLEIFLNVIQAVLDSADSMNFAESLGDQNNTSILLTEIVGGDPVNVIPGEYLDPVPDGVTTCTEDGDEAGCELVDARPDGTIPNAADEEVWGIARLNDTFIVDGQAISVNAVTGTPLAGTEPLINLMGAVQTAEDAADRAATPSADPLVNVTRYTRGSHSTPVTAGVTNNGTIITDKFSSARVFSEMVSQLVSLFVSENVGGPIVAVSDGCVIEASDNNDRAACPVGEPQ